MTERLTGCYGYFSWRLKTIQNLHKDILDEATAIDQYQRHIDFIKNNEAVGVATNPKLWRSISPAIDGFVDKLNEIMSEEIHHKEELQSYVNTEWFNLLNALEDYSTCREG